MSGTTEIGLDTSGLVNYVYSSLPGDLEEDRGCQRLIDETAHYTVIGGKVKGEFEALCERRYDLYEDVVDYLLETENPIFEYDPRDRGIHVSPNDRTHFREDIQMSWHAMDRRKQLSTLRRCLQDIDLYQIQLSQPASSKSSIETSRFSGDSSIGSSSLPSVSGDPVQPAMTAVVSAAPPVMNPLRRICNR